MKEDTNELKEWSFQIDEISANVYRVWGVDPLGRRVEKVGDDPDILLQECKTDALKITESSRDES